MFCFMIAAVSKALINWVVGFVFAFPLVPSYLMWKMYHTYPPSTYYTRWCFISFLLPARPVKVDVPVYEMLVCVCVCLQGVMQDVQILVMPQGYIAQCPDLNRSECSFILKTRKKHFIQCVLSFQLPLAQPSVQLICSYISFLERL